MSDITPKFDELPDDAHIYVHPKIDRDNGCIANPSQDVTVTMPDGKVHHYIRFLAVPDE